MAMSVDIQQATGAGPSWGNVTAVKWNRVDDASGTTPIPTPTATGTNFSYIKTMVPNITNADSLTMTDIKVGKTATEATSGTKLWHYTAHVSYTQATGAPSSTGDDNVTGPTMNGATGTAVPLIGSASVYDAGPYSTAVRCTNKYVEVCLGVDSTNVTAGTTVDTPTLRWQWTEG